jgi:hypothetical protein
MTESEVAFLVGFIVVVSTFVMFYGPWQTWVVAYTRQRIFELRDVWFDSTALAENTRDLLGTRAVRDTCNRSIRSVEMMTWPTLIVVGIVSKLAPIEPPKSDLGRGIHELPSKELRQVGLRIANCSAQYVAAQLLARSIIGVPFGVWALWRLRREHKHLCSRPGRTRADSPFVLGQHKRFIREKIQFASAASADPRFARFLSRSHRSLNAV